MNLQNPWYLCDINNFGDQFNRVLNRFYSLNAGFENIISKTNKVNSGIFGVGSILEHASDFYSGVIAGSGFMFSSSRKSFYHADVLAVRGSLTAERIFSHRSIFPLLDPGILISKIYPASDKMFELGIVPHYIDFNSAHLEKFRQKYLNEVLIIDVKNDPKIVAEQISSCCNIASSSLHGLVVADSYSIPSVWIKLSNKLEGGEFKFYDYKSAYSINASPYLRTEYSLDNLLCACQDPPRSVQEKIQNADELFNNLKEILLSHSKKNIIYKKINYLKRRFYRKILMKYRSISSSY